MTRTMLVAHADTPIGRAVAQAATEAGYRIVGQDGADDIDALFVAPRPIDVRDRSIETLSPQDFTVLVDRDLGATVRLLRAALPRLLAARGTIILLTRDSGTGPTDMIASTVAAEANATLAKSITYQYGAHGLRANAIAIPANDRATTSDIAKLVLFLASPDASYMTGTVVPAGHAQGRS